jgi:hypothetical protein
LDKDDKIEGVYPPSPAGKVEKIRVCVCVPAPIPSLPAFAKNHLANGEDDAVIDDRPSQSTHEHENASTEYGGCAVLEIGDGR